MIGGVVTESLLVDCARILAGGCRGYGRFRTGPCRPDLIAAAGSSATVSGVASGPDGRTRGVGCRCGWGDSSHHRLRRPYQQRSDSRAMNTVPL